MKQFLVSRREVQTLASMTASHLRVLVSKGRLVEQDALIGKTVRKGITLESLAAYFGWSPSTVDQVLYSHGVDPDSDGFHYLSARDE